MTYIRSKHPRPRARVPAKPSGLGGILDAIFGSASPDPYADQINCIKAANATPQVAQIDAEISRLAQTWKPTGYYLITDVQAILDRFATEAAAAGAALATTRANTSGADSLINEAFDDLKSKYQDRSYAYVQGIADARSKGSNVVDAPNLKNWVLSSLQAISDAYVTSYAIVCGQDFKWLNKALQVVVAIGEILYQIVGVVVDAAVKVGKVLDNTLDIAVFLSKYAVPAAVVAGIYYFAVHKRR